MKFNFIVKGNPIVLYLVNISLLMTLPAYLASIYLALAGSLNK